MNLAVIIGVEGGVEAIEDIGHGGRLRALGAYTPLANLTGLPAIAVPCGVDDRGRPLSIMFMVAAGEEDMLLRVALAVEQAGLGMKSVAMS